MRFERCKDVQNLLKIPYNLVELVLSCKNRPRYSRERAVRRFFKIQEYGGVLNGNNGGHLGTSGSPVCVVFAVWLHPMVVVSRNGRRRQRSWKSTSRKRRPMARKLRSLRSKRRYLMPRLSQLSCLHSLQLQFFFPEKSAY